MDRRRNRRGDRDTEVIQKLDPAGQAHMNDRPDIVQRVIVGPVLFLTGVIIQVGLLMLAFKQPEEMYKTIGVVLFAEAYTGIGMLFVLLGLKYMLGPRSWIERWMKRSVSRLLVASALMGAVIVAAVTIVAWYLV